MNARRVSARLLASAAFLAAFTLAVLLVRSGLAEDDAPPAATTAAVTQEGTTTGAVTLPEGTTAVAPEFYVIKAGDTLETVAAAHETTVERLLVLNPDVDPVALTIGERIRVK